MSTASILPGQDSNQYSVQRAVQTVQAALGVSVRVSDWSIVSDSSLTVSAGIFKIADFSVGGFTMTLANGSSRSKIKLKGVGIGAGLSALPGLPVDVSGDPQSVAQFLIPYSPFAGLKSAIKNIAATVAASMNSISWNSPIFVVPPNIDSAQLFGGWAQIISAGLGVGGEISVGAIVFFDLNLEVAIGSLLLGPMLAPLGLAAAARAKALLLFGGPDVVTDTSAGVQGIIYRVAVNPIAG
jgi:hypothetical protein